MPEKQVKRIFPLIILVALLTLVYWMWFFPGINVASDFPSVSTPAMQTLLDIPQTWSEKGSEGLGEYTVFTLSSYPLMLFSGIIANLGVNFIILEKILFIFLFLFIGVWSTGRLSQYLKFSKQATIISSLFYLANSYILLLIDGGQLSIGFAYALFPLCFLMIEKSITGNLRQKILTGLIVSMLGFLDIRFIYVLFLLELGRFLYEFLFLESKKWREWIWNWITLAFVLSLIIIALNAFWLYPMFFVPITSDFYAWFTQTSFLSFTTLGHSMTLLSPHWFKNTFGVITPLRFEFIFIPILVYLAPLLRPKNKLVGFWLLVSLLAIFLVKGSSSPFPQVYPWLYSNLPGFSLFRDSSKFFFLLALSYSILLGITIDEISKRLEGFPKIRIFFFCTLIGYILFLIRPIWAGEMTGTLSFPPFQKEYGKLAELLKSDKQFSRVFWIPATMPLTYASPTHPIQEASRLVQKRPFAIAVKGTYETFNFIREASYMGELFDVAGIGYIAYPPLDLRRVDPHPDNLRYYNIFLNQLSSLPWTNGLVKDSPIPLIQMKNHQGKFFVPGNVWWVIGADDIYQEATKSAVAKLSNNALIFADENPELKKLDEMPDAKIVLNKKTMIDLAAGFITPKEIIFPAQKMSDQPDKTGWWRRGAKDLVSFRYFLVDKYGVDNKDFDMGGGWAIGEKNLELTVKNTGFQKGKVLLSRAMESSRSGQLQFSQGNEIVGKIETKQENNNVRWFEVGILKNSSDLVLKTSGDINVINALAVLDKSEWENLKARADGYQRNGKIVSFDEKNMELPSGKVTYEQMTPTKYLVKVSNLEKRAFLVFSQTYHPLWKLNGKGSTPVYGFLNGFYIDKNGEYILEFEPQKYVLPGLTASLGALAIIVVLLVWPFRRRTS